MGGTTIHGALGALLTCCGLSLAACARGTGVEGLTPATTTDDVQPAHATDTGLEPAADGAPATKSDAQTSLPDAAMPPVPELPPPECDLTGKWAVAQFTDSIAVVLGVNAAQRAVNYFYFDVVQQGTSFTIMNSLRCGLRVTGATTVTVSDATLSALLGRDNSDGRRGTYTPNASKGCDLTLEEIVNVMGCSTPYYRINRSQPLPATPASGMNAGTEDWDQDGFDGITLNSGGGPRYVAMRDWNSYAGTTPQFVTDKFQVKVNWDSEEQVLDPTNLIIRAPSHRDDAGDHHAVWKRLAASDNIPRTTGLETCKAIQTLLAGEK